MKKNIIFGAAVLAVIIAVQTVFNIQNSKEEEIISAFSQMDFTQTGSNIEAVVNYGNTYMNEETKKELMYSIADQIGIKEPLEYNTEQNTKGSTITIKKTSDNVEVLIKYVSIENEVEENVLELEQYIIINMKFKEGIESAVSYKNLIEKIFTKMELKAKTTLNLTGSYNGKLEDSVKDSIVDNLLKAIGGKIVVQKKDSDIYNIYAYTDFVDDFITVEKKKVNVNIAVDYDENTGTTNILLSTPIINTDY